MRCKDFGWHPDCFLHISFCSEQAHLSNESWTYVAHSWGWEGLRNTVEKLNTMSQEILRNINKCFTWSPESPTRSRSLLYLVDLEPGTTTPSMGWLGPNREVRAALQNHTPYSWIPQKCSGNPYSTWLVQNIHLFTCWVCACRWVLWAPRSPWWDRRRRQGCQTQSVCHSPKRWHT